jgi:hypothetical protein
MTMKRSEPTGGDPPYPRLFTIEEAQSVLGEIEPLVAEMKTLFVSIRQEIAGGLERDRDPRRQREAVGLTSSAGSPEPDRPRQHADAGHHERGCVVNGPEAGLVDFPALLGSEIVFLCWKHGERSIGHWHRIPDGFAGRKPLLDAKTSGDEPSRIH